MFRLYSIIVLLSVCLNAFPLWAGGKHIIRGQVKSQLTKERLSGANIYLQGTTIGTYSNAHGKFVLRGIPSGRYTLVISYMGYSEQKHKLNLQADTTLFIQLNQKLINGPLVTVVATRARERFSPVTFSNIDKSRLEADYTTQDIPEILAELPSTSFYSESGSGTGYNYLSIRGFDQRRISVLINGVPQNDPEDQNTYWVDFPDLLANVQSIQVQRGAGSAFYGPAAIGGSVNIITNYFSPRRLLKAQVGYGSYHTQKRSLSYNSGLLGKHTVLFGRVSNIKTDGYRDGAWINFWNYFLGAAYYGHRQNLRLHFYGGPIKDGLVYKGLPKFVNDNDQLRKKNFAYWEVNERGDSLIAATERDPAEVENFNQPHLELIHEYKLSNHVTLNNTAFYIRGYGFFDYDGSWATPEYFRLTPQYGFDSTTAIPSDALIRAYVANRQFGWLPQWQWRKGNEEMIIGAEWRYHHSLHWGRLQRGNGLPPEIVGEQGRHYYQYEGEKQVFSAYLHDTHQLFRNLFLTTDLQYTFKQYRLFKEQFLHNDFKVPYHFLNPRIGINYNLNATANMYVSLTRTSREPRLKNLYDAAEASTPADWGAVTPQFEVKTNGSYNFDRPLVHPETLYGMELGYSYRSERLRAGINYYYMDFINEIIKKGGVDRFGQPITGNARRTLHRGLELSGSWRMFPRLSLRGNFTYSKNTLVAYTVYKYEGASGQALPIVLDGNPIAGFPDILGNFSLMYSWKGLYAVLGGKYMGRMYTDNFKNKRHTVDPYMVLNFRFRINLQAVGLKGLALQGKINNLLNRRYLAFGEGDEFFPAAPRNYFVSLQYSY